MTLLRGGSAAPARTLVDIFDETVRAFPDAPAIDSGAEVLTYAEFAEAADEVAQALGRLGVGSGDRVGIRIRSGTTALYVAIMGSLLAGAAYVPVDADDPDERARTLFEEADVDAVIGNDLAITVREEHDEPVPPQPPTPADDAWIIFTSGSTGKPKAVAVSHRSAAAFVDAEAHLFLTGRARSVPATGSWRACRSRSTPPARRCGWPGDMGPPSCRRRARWSAAGWSWVRG